MGSVSDLGDVFKALVPVLGDLLGNLAGGSLSPVEPK
ncbi:hypothetical protein SAMN05444583_102191 [Rhodococcus maanshanensis]|uniref:Uncharacterized protein n=1 Tax=Rhodococcus maanshanensis TaxID=183556 RepID=A0A1H7HQ21_9NOCA|nr:hypothetical protein SAMN05444583_102191 [Rhodococcus maanshanensis]